MNIVKVSRPTLDGDAEWFNRMPECCQRRATIGRQCIGNEQRISCCRRQTTIICDGWCHDRCRGCRSMVHVSCCRAELRHDDRPVRQGQLEFHPLAIAREESNGIVRARFDHVVDVNNFIIVRIQIEIEIGRDGVGDRTQR